MPTRPRHVSQVLQHDGLLKPLQGEMQRQQQLLRQIRQALPANLSAHCSGARLSGGVLCLYADTPVWLSRLRFQAPALLSRLRAAYPAIASIKVRCEAPQRGISSPRPRHPARHSNRAAASIEESAAGIASPALSTALRRLARVLRED